MTQASPLSRLEKLASKYADIFGERNDSLYAGFIAGWRARTQDLSEPGEACGPLSDAAISERARGQRYPNGYATNQQSGDYFAHGYEIGAKWVRTELLQARAALENMKWEYENACKFATDFEEKLASSEARVRILSEAVENIGCHTLAGVLRVENGRDNCLDATALDNIVRQALLEVKR